MGYKFQFVTLAGFHALNHSMFELANGYRDRGMAAYSELQEAEFAAEKDGYTATRHQREVGTGYFDEVVDGHHRRRVLHDRAHRLDRSRAVPLGRAGWRQPAPRRARLRLTARAGAFPCVRDAWFARRLARSVRRVVSVRAARARSARHRAARRDCEAKRYDDIRCVFAC